MKLDDKLHKGEGTTEIARMAVENVAWFREKNSTGLGIMTSSS